MKSVVPENKTAVFIHNQALVILDNYHPIFFSVLFRILNVYYLIYRFSIENKVKKDSRKPFGIIDIKVQIAQINLLLLKPEIKHQLFMIVCQFII